MKTGAKIGIGGGVLGFQYQQVRLIPGGRHV